MSVSYKTKAQVRVRREEMQWEYQDRELPVEDLVLYADLRELLDGFQAAVTNAFFACTSSPQREAFVSIIEQYLREIYQRENDRSGNIPAAALAADVPDTNEGHADGDLDDDPFDPPPPPVVCTEPFINCNGVCKLSCPRDPEP